LIKRGKEKKSGKEEKTMGGKEASAFSNYIFSHFIVLHELGRSTSKRDLILQGLRFLPVF